MQLCSRWGDVNDVNAGLARRFAVEISINSKSSLNFSVDRKVTTISSLYMCAIHESVILGPSGVGN